MFNCTIAFNIQALAFFASQYPCNEDTVSNRKYDNTHPQQCGMSKMFVVKYSRQNANVFLKQDKQRRYVDSKVTNVYEMNLFTFIKSNISLRIYITNYNEYISSSLTFSVLTHCKCFFHLLF